MKPKLFIDSGAYTAKTKGQLLSIGEYAGFLHQWRRYIEVAAGLDVIFDAEATWTNQQEIEVRLGEFFHNEAATFPVLPTFHIGEDFKWLKKYAEEYDYIGLGGTASRKFSSADRAAWLEECWGTYLTDDDGLPITRVHGFAATGVDVMKKFPWYSVDSTSWLLSAAMGNAIFCDVDPLSGQWDLIDVSVSKKTPLDVLPPLQREAAAMLIKKHEFELNTLEADYRQRFFSNAKAYVTFASKLKYKPFLRQTRDLFGGISSRKTKKKACKPWEHLTFYLAGNPGAKDMTKSLMELGYNRLLSYWYVKENDGHFSQAKEVLDSWDKEQASEPVHHQPK